MELKRQIERYQPTCEQEVRDRLVMLRALEQFDDCLNRSNEILHFTASGWIVNPNRTRVLMVYHNIYQSWSWTGGHADGDDKLLHVAIREAREETALNEVSPVAREIFSLEILPVFAHVRRGQYVNTHLHLNATYLLVADEAQQLRCKPDENSAVRWFSMEECIRACSEPWMHPIYQKLNQRVRTSASGRATIN